MKTYRKYEVFIRELEIQNEQLTAKLKKEQLMRSPTKEYMTEMLDKIVELRRTVEQLSERIDELNDTVRQKDEAIREQKLGIVRQEQLLRINMSKLPRVEDKPNDELKETVRRFTEVANNKASACCLPMGKFVGFLRANLERFRSVEALLKETQKWCEPPQGEGGCGSTVTQPNDLWRVKYTISKAVSEHDKSPSPLARKRVSLATIDTGSGHKRSRHFKTEVAMLDGRRASRI